MSSKSDLILEHVIGIEKEQGATNQHLKTLNGSVQRHEKEFITVHKRMNKIARREARNSGKLIIIGSILTLILGILFAIFKESLIKTIS